MKNAALRDGALLVLRLSGIGMAVAHGWGKVFALATGEGAGFISGVESLGFPFPVLFAWAAALAEFVGGLCVALGLATRVAAAAGAFTMCVAAFVRHHFHDHLLTFAGLRDPSPEQVEGWGNPEMALLYLIIFLTLVLTGGGRFSLDQLIRRKR